jgi:phenylpropionate dioxygenase-like ring-hydroxylating dioxygenase large terminal subunit
VTLAAALRRFWYPACTAAELGASGIVGTQLLGVPIVVADAGGTLLALHDRCLHRSTQLSAGWVCGDTIQCAYHGWRYDASGACVEIPALPDGPIPSRARVDAYEVTAAYGLVWVRLERGWPTVVPPHPSWDDPEVHVAVGEPYTWPTSLERRVENFADLAHFAWVHEGTLSSRAATAPPVPDVRRERGELVFAYDPPVISSPDDRALVGRSIYRVAVPGTVDIEFDVPGAGRRHLWMTVAPLDADDTEVRCYWTMSRTDDLEGDDGPYLDFQELILEQDRPLIFAQQPRNIPFEPGAELSVRTDRVSIEYRRWLTQIMDAADPDTLGLVLG